MLLPDELKDCRGELNNHEDYVDLLNKLEDKTAYIQVTLIMEEKTSKIHEKFKEDIIKEELVNAYDDEDSTNCSEKRYTIKSSKELFDYLKTFETFVKYQFDERGGIYDGAWIKIKEYEELKGKMSTEEIIKKYQELNKDLDIDQLESDLDPFDESFDNVYTFLLPDDHIESKAVYTDFGLDDITFFDENDNILLATVTHEGAIWAI